MLLITGFVHVFGVVNEFTVKVVIAWIFIIVQASNFKSLTYHPQFILLIKAHEEFNQILLYVNQDNVNNLVADAEPENFIVEFQGYIVRFVPENHEFIAQELSHVQFQKYITLVFVQLELNQGANIS